ncbi:MAG: hypothetical protein JNM10_15385 [Planctomycetia bacterium]|nr:hypothetical protein [Planctomycetia bacterium]
MATAAWLDLARAVDAAFGAWATARALLRTRSTPPAVAWPSGPPHTFGGRDGAGATTTVLATIMEAACIARASAFGANERIASRMFEQAAKAAGWPEARLAWVKAATGGKTPIDFFTAGRDEVRRGLTELTPEEVKVAKAKVVAYLGDPIEELRVAAALALRRAGDPAGADLLLKAIEDPVEGPEVRWALTKLAGDDRGDTAGAWEEFVRAGGAK